MLPRPPSSTPLRYELLLRSEGYKYAIIDHQAEAWATLNILDTTWGSLPRIFSTSTYGYTFRQDFEGDSPYSYDSYLTQLRKTSHISSLGYFESPSQFMLDNAELFI